ncbi:Fur-regulated basic protein FbpA [Sporolactobacillus vineae]|nr:Fur-regulated basic protein FbpA [Sporolactobacillus vineae]
MTMLFHQTVESKREELINQLIDADVYKINGKQLFELPLSKLERTCRQVRLRKNNEHTGT